MPNAPGRKPSAGDGKKRARPGGGAKKGRGGSTKPPPVREAAKNVLFLRGLRASEAGAALMKDLHALTSPHSKMLSRKNENVLPFESVESLEFLCSKNECAMFALFSHSKKRPDNLTLGRTYDGHVLDMVEFGVTDTVSVVEASEYSNSKRFGSKACLLFVGDRWERDPKLETSRSLLLDLFKGIDVDAIQLQSLDHVMVCTALDNGAIAVRGYHLRLQKSGGRVPAVRMMPMGPHFTLTPRRFQIASADEWRAACRVPKALMPKKVKNVATSALGDTVARLRMDRQDMSELDSSVRKTKALRGAPKKKQKVEE